jgi:hypothetical protein
MIAPRRVTAALCALGAVVALAACTTAGAKPEVRRTPLAVPTAPAAASLSAPPSPAADDIDVEASEQLLLAATAHLTVVVDGHRSSVSLSQSPLVDSVVEQTAGETKRVLRLWTADPARPSEASFSLEGVATPGSFRTGQAGLKLAYFDARTGVDLLSDDGSCAVVFGSADASGARGTISCRGVDDRDQRIRVTGRFAATLG